MEDAGLRALFSILLMLGNGFCVAAEYGIVSSRRSRIEGLAKKGNSSAKSLLFALDHVSRYVAGIQVAISMFSIGIGSITEPLVTRWVTAWIGGTVGKGFSLAFSFVLVAFALVVIGELIPKYLALNHAERLALILIRPLNFLILVLRPLVWLVEKTGTVLLRPFGIDTKDLGEDALSKEELKVLIRTGGAEGVLDEHHARFVSRALRLDDLDASDIMVHRLDVKWLDISTQKEELLGKAGEMSHTRIPVCRGDIDDMVGVLYLQDLLRKWNHDNFCLETILRPVEAIPENLPLSRIIDRMRESKSQILIVMDEYGGTSGLITLEDVVEEVFGELEDQMESERPPIERIGTHRLSARADVRFDELLEYLGKVDESEEPITETLAQLIIDELGEVPKLGDSIELPIGRLRVENMARRRITRVSIQLVAEAAVPDS